MSSLHHMLSTGTCAGVYNSPYDQMAPATVYGLPIEEHLRNVARGTLRQQIRKKFYNGDFLYHIYQGTDLSDFFVVSAPPSRASRGRSSRRKPGFVGRRARRASTARRMRTGRRMGGLGGGGNTASVGVAVASCTRTRPSLLRLRGSSTKKISRTATRTGPS